MCNAQGNSSNSPVSLGCGTLILIAIIVVIFSGGSGIDQLKSETNQLQNDIARLEEKLDRLIRSVQELQDSETLANLAESPQQ